MKRTLLARLIILAALVAAVFLVRECRHRQEMLTIQPAQPSASSRPQPKDTGAEKTTTRRRTTDVPEYALQVLDYVVKNGRAPDGYVGGRTFQNREHRLSERDPQGQTIRYREWDVYPKIEGKNRGPERLVTGSDRSAWYTPDHYRTFLKVKSER